MAYTTINKSTDYFNTNLIPSASEITAVGHQADMIWLKSRTAAHSHELIDTVRGISKKLKTDVASAESTDANIITAIGSDSYTVGSSSNSIYGGNNGVGWSWKANGTGSANTDGDVTSTVSVNTTSGFSIVKWDSTGTAGINIGHGLGQKPAMIIAKCLNQSSTSWPVYHQSLGATKYVSLQATTAETTSATRWNNSEPTTTTFQTGSSGDIGGSDRTMIAYCFAEKPGYSKMGSYTGNGNDNGAFTYTGFFPAFVMLKRTDSTSRWRMYDNKINPFNVADTRLSAESNDAENTSALNAIDMISQGFKIRTSESQLNASGGSFIYMAFGQSIVGSNNIPATAR
tara:strand:+ start:754 stop:1782 length:1029 start_codon:yes stop_codon:yes gene_type:complete